MREGIGVCYGRMMREGGLRRRHVLVGVPGTGGRTAWRILAGGVVDCAGSCCSCLLAVLLWVSEGEGGGR